MKFLFMTSKLNDYDKNINVVRNFEVTDVTNLSDIRDNCVMFSKKWSEDTDKKLENCKNSIIIAPEDAIITYKILENNQVIYSKNPRLEYAKLLQFIVSLNKENYTYKKLDENDVFGSTIVVGTTAKIGNNTKIEPHVYIENSAEIGENCLIKKGVYIGPYVKIGNNSIIRENSVIGGWGFGVERDDEGKTHKIPHIGGVTIGSNVEIGALNTVVTGTMKPTLVDDYTKTDDHVHIAHNCQVGQSCIITACAEFSGSLKLGKNSWIGPNVSMMESIELAEGTLVGIGSVVTKSVTEPNNVIFGNPARTKEEHAKLRDGK